MNGDQVSFQNTLPILSISTYVTKELNIGRLSPEWLPSAFSKDYTKFICFHTGHKRTEIWQTNAFSKYYTKLFVSTQATKERKIERLSP